MPAPPAAACAPSMTYPECPAAAPAPAPAAPAGMRAAVAVVCAVHAAECCLPHPSPAATYLRRQECSWQPVAAPSLTPSCYFDA